MGTQIERSRFALRNFAGAPTEFFRVEREDLSAQTAAPATPLSDLFLIFDRSGSMYSTIEDVKASALKTLTMSEFKDPNLRVSLITYSSRGDVKLHFHRVLVSDIMATNSSYQGEIRAIRATAYTCISQALEMVDTLVDDTRTTGVLMHTDGCANDSSPTAERRAMEVAVGKMRRHPKLFMNTVAHGSWADTNLLMELANKLSGRMLAAHDQRGIYNAIHDTASLLVGAPAPAVEIGLGTASYAAFVSRADSKILGSADNITVRGLSSSADRAAYRYWSVSEAEYNASTDPVCGDGAASVEPVLVYARAMLAEGRPVRAKFALVATRHGALLADHARAQVPSALARFAEALDRAICAPTPYTPQADYGLGARGPSVLKVLSVLNKYSDAIEVNLPVLSAGYRRCGLRRVAGTRGPDGVLVPPTVESRFRGGDGYVSVNGFEANRDTATINMLLSRPIDLYRREDGAKIDEVAGIRLDGLRAFNNYTLVSNGELNIQSLPIRVSDKRAFRELKELGVVSGDYTPGCEAAVNLAALPLIEYDQTFTSVSRDTVHQLHGLAAVGKFLGEVTKGESTSLTSEQIAALKEVYLSPKLNFSPPTTNEYTSLEEAIATGKVDTRLDYAIGFGTPEITSPTKLPSGNAFLQRRFTLTVDGAEVAKPTLNYVGAKGAVWGVKKLSARTQLTAIDSLMYPLFGALLGLEDASALDGILPLAGVDRAALVASLASGDREAAVTAATDASRAVDRAVESIYDTLRPLAFYIGASGLVPDSLGARPMTVEEVEKTYPEAKLSSAEKDDGMFYMLPSGVLLTVYVRGSHFSTSAAA